MNARHLDRIWIFAGAAVIVVLVAATWFLLISPNYSEAAALRDQAASTRAQQATLQHKLAELKQQYSQLATFRAARDKSRLALPSDSGVPDFLRQLQASGDKAVVSVSNVTVTAPALVTGSTSLYQVPITLTVEGSINQLSAFLVRLQNVQPRAVLVQSVNLVSGAADSSGGDTVNTAGRSSNMQINLGLTAFVAPPAGAGAPIVTTN